MFCFSCGARNNGTNQFCTSCGMRLAPPSPGGTTRVHSGAPGDHGPGASPANVAAYGRSPAEQQSLPVHNGAYGNNGPAWTPPYQGAHPAGTSQWPDGSSRMMAPYWQSYPEAVGRPFHPTHTIICAECGLLRSAATDTCPYCGKVLVNTSGHNAPIPLELNARWNWGAFLFPVLWSISHENWFGLLALVPGLNIIIPFVLGARGNELAWQNRRFNSVEHFLDVQRAWRNWSIGGMAVMAAIYVMWAFSAG